jgi:hypothetical protein
VTEDCEKKSFRIPYAHGWWSEDHGQEKSTSLSFFKALETGHCKDGHSVSDEVEKQQSPKIKNVLNSKTKVRCFRSIDY